MERRSSLKRKLEDLNEQFYSWVHDQHQHNLHELWLDGVQVYQKAALALLEEHRSIATTKQQEQSNGLSAVPPKFGSLASAQEARPDTASTKADANGGLSLWGQTSFPKTGTSFSWAAPSTGPITFASPKPAGQSNFFSFGQTPQATKPNGVENTQPTAREAVNDDSADPEGSEPAEPVQLDPTADVLFAGTATYFMATPNEGEAWANRGKGKLTLRRPPPDSGGKQCYLVFTTESGRVLVNASLYKGLKPVLKGKGRVMLSLAVSGQGADLEQKITLFRLGENESKELAALIEENVPK